jgi:hypothetical protein
MKLGGKLNEERRGNGGKGLFFLLEKEEKNSMLDLLVKNGNVFWVNNIFFFVFYFLVL